MSDSALTAAFAVLGIAPTRVALPHPPGTHLPFDELVSAQLAELQRPYVALVTRDGCPPARWVVAADSWAALVARLPRPRPGPNGPVDGIRIIRPA